MDVASNNWTVVYCKKDIFKEYKSNNFTNNYYRYILFNCGYSCSF